MDIQNQMELKITVIRFMDITKYIFGYPIFNMIFGYLIMYLRISLNITDFWISINLIVDILKYNYGYPKMYLDIHMNYGYP